ncbi:MAG: aminotransferase class I/II-fold pyridoxal phosphate-dependent enzyme [Planctomycetota bacterium]|nr:aminotransferase class I/II-fold pyridoxal phosphate-dependent enzyme [Planctomycetota bacterium]
MSPSTTRRAGPRPNPGIQRPYRDQAPTAPTDLRLAGNEGQPAAALELRLGRDRLRRYPSTAEVAGRAAERFGVAADQVLVTAGADDALLRIALAFLAPGRSAVVPSPTFEMIPRYATVAGGDVVEVPWEPGAPYPLDAALGAVREDSSLVYVVSPNNPTGAVATAADVLRACDEAPDALVVVDQAYGEFADEDLTGAALSRPNAVVLRTMSKAYGAAGLRVGFAVGRPELLRVLEAAGNPYPCAAPSLDAALQLLGTDLDASIEAVRAERVVLVERLRALGLDAAPSQGNFVYARTPAADALRVRVAEEGVAIRSFGRAVRVTCPASARDFQRLLTALEVACQEVLS